MRGDRRLGEGPGDRGARAHGDRRRRARGRGAEGRRPLADPHVHQHQRRPARVDAARCPTSRCWTRSARTSRSPKSYTDDVEFSAQDATRTPLEFLLECFRVAVACGATTINVPDTVGYATPTEFGELVRIVRDETPDDVVISTHCHNDLGLAVANSLAGIENGAGQVEVAVNGIGERAGNCSLEEIAMILRTRGEALGATHGLNLQGDRAHLAAGEHDHRLQRAAEQGRRGLQRVRARERHPSARRAQQPRDLRDHGPGRDRPGGQPARAGQALRPPRVRRRAGQAGHRAGRRRR